jgi:ribosomal protein L31E
MALMKKHRAKLKQEQLVSRTIKAQDTVKVERDLSQKVWQRDRRCRPSRHAVRQERARDREHARERERATHTHSSVGLWGVEGRRVRGSDGRGVGACPRRRRRARSCGRGSRIRPGASSGTRPGPSGAFKRPQTFP